MFNKLLAFSAKRSLRRKRIKDAKRAKELVVPLNNDRALEIRRQRALEMLKHSLSEFRTIVVGNKHRVVHLEFLSGYGFVYYEIDTRSLFARIDNERQSLTLDKLSPDILRKLQDMVDNRRRNIAR